MKPTISTLNDFIRNETEGGTQLKEVGLTKSIAANKGRLFVPEYDVRCFIAQTLLAQNRQEYEIRETVTVGTRKISDSTYLPAMIEEEATIPRPFKESQGFQRTHRHTTYEGDHAQSVYGQFTKELDQRLKEFCKSNKIIRSEGLGIFSPRKSTFEFIEDPYPYIIGERQLSTTEKRKHLLATLDVRSDVGILELRDEYCGFKRTYSRSEFLETRTERLKLRWSGDAGFQYSFPVCGIPFK